MSEVIEIKCKDFEVNTVVERIRNDDIKAVEESKADITLKFMEEWDKKIGPLNNEIEKKIKMKVWFLVFPTIFAVNFMLFMDKNAMGYSSLLGLFEDAKLTQQTYNDLQTIFYVGYLAGQLPSHYIFQRVPLSKYIGGVTLIWALLTLVHLAIHDFSGLAAVRFFLGLFESGVTPCLEQTIAMWFTPEEQAIVNPLFWISCLAVGIPGGLISYGVQFVNVRPWKVYWSIIGGGTFLLSAWNFIFYPDNPATYRFMTAEERFYLIKRIKSATQSSIEQKVFKKYQLIEALRDPISWLFVIHVLLLMLCNNISFQAAIIYQDLGISQLDSTLVAVASAGWSTVLSIIGSLLLVRFRAQTANVGTLFCCISLLGGFLAVALPWEVKKGMLAGIFLTNATGICFIGAFSWSQSSAAGYTKRLVRTVLWSISYSVVNLFASQIWQTPPRYYGAWITMIIGSWFAAPIVLQIIRFILSRRNKERIKWIEEVREGRMPATHGFVDELDEQGNITRKEVDISMLDLTDLENKKFIYPL